MIRRTSHAVEHCINCLLISKHFFLIYSFGHNTKALPKLKTFLEILLESLQESTIKILFFSGIASLVISWFNDKEQYAWFEGVSIMVACLFITVLASLCNWGKEKQYLKLHDEIMNEEVSVIRGQYGLSQ